jgi:hypothetical protein
VKAQGATACALRQNSRLDLWIYPLSLRHEPTL